MSWLLLVGAALNGVVFAQTGSSVVNPIRLGTLTTRIAADGIVDTSGPQVFFEFEVKNSVTATSVSLGTDLAGLVNFALLGRIGDEPAISEIEVATGIGSTPYSIRNHWLDPGVYYIRVTRRSDSRFQITVDGSSKDSPGNTDNSLGKAIHLGNAGQPLRVQEFVGPSDPSDWYSFEVTDSVRDVILSITSTSGQIMNLSLYGRPNISGATVMLESATGIGSTTYTLANNWLDPGTYYLQVSQRAKTEYQIDIHSNPINSPGLNDNGPSDAFPLGSVRQTRTAADFVGPSDTEDWYTFEVTHTSRSVRAFVICAPEGVVNAYLFRSSASGGVGVEVDSATGIGGLGYTLPRVPGVLEPGRYFVRIVLRSKTRYDLEVSSSLPPGTIPFIVGQPVSRTADAGTPVNFTVDAEGSGPLSFQWSFEGNPIPGATGATYAIPTLRTGDSGQYSVRVSNGFGSATSQAAILTVDDPDTRVSIEKGVYLSWEGRFENWILQESGTVNGPWLDISPPLRAVVSGRVECAVRTNGQTRFFRLRKP